MFIPEYDNYSENYVIPKILNPFYSWKYEHDLL
jgi:hypothetical protein